MARGTLRLRSGLGATCDYQLTPDTGGRLKLPSALYLPLREDDAGTLRLEDGDERRVAITFGPQVGEASFSYVD